MAAATGQVMTVLGPIAPEEAGITSTHDHVLVSMECYWTPPTEVSKRTLYERPVDMSVLGYLRRNPLGIKDNMGLYDLDTSIDELLRYKEVGGGTLVDLTLPDIGRDPGALQIAARMTGLHIVAGCGHYISIAHPPSLRDESVEDVAERMLGEIENGIGDSGVRPGIIGEIGTTEPLHPDEEKVLRAAARVQQASGLAISLHLDPAAGKGLEILEILESEGADPGRVVMGHLDATIDDTLDYHRALAEQGCYVQYDAVGSESYWPGLAGGSSFWLPADSARARAVATAFERGYGDRIVLGHDVCKKMDLVRYGGFGYAHIVRHFVPNLRETGLGQEEIDQVLVTNPTRLLTRV